MTSAATGFSIALSAEYYSARENAAQVLSLLSNAAFSKACQIPQEYIWCISYQLMHRLCAICPQLRLFHIKC